MQELLLAVARGLVEDKDAVKVTVDEPREDGTIVYHLSVAEGDMGRVIEEIGTYDPNKEPSEVKIDAEKAKQWIANGAQPTDTVRLLLKKSNIL